MDQSLTYLDGNFWIPVVPKSVYDERADLVGATHAPTVLVYIGEHETLDVVPKAEYDALPVL